MSGEAASLPSGTCVSRARNGCSSSLGGEPDVDAPVLDRPERPDLALALDDQAHGDRLDAAGGQAGPDAAPQERADLVADQPVEDPAGLLGVDQLQVDLAGLRNASRIASRVISVKVTRLASRGVGAEQRSATWKAMASPSRSKSVASTRSSARLRARFSSATCFLESVGHLVGLELVLDVHAEVALGQVADVAVRGPDGVVGAQVLLDGLRLGRRLDDHQRLRHTSITSVSRGVEGPAPPRGTSRRRVPAPAVNPGIIGRAHRGCTGRQRGRC